jgi:hypothetical protein
MNLREYIFFIRRYFSFIIGRYQGIKKLLVLEGEYPMI